MLKPIRSETDYDKALGRAYRLMQLEIKPRSKESDELEVLSMLIEHYEAEHYPISPPHPVEAIKFRMDQLGMKRSELGRGSRGASR